MRIWIGVVICAFLGGLHVGVWLEREHGAGRSGGAWMNGQATERVRKRTESPRLIVRLRPGVLPLVVDRTAYSLERRQTDATPEIAACGRISSRGVEVASGRFLPAIAVSQDLFQAKQTCGRRVLMNGRSYWIWDTMAAHWTRRVDVLMPSRADALHHGIRRGLLEMDR